MTKHFQPTNRTHLSLAIAAWVLALVAGSPIHAAPVTLDSVKESHVRESQPTINQGQSRLIFGAQGSATTEFHVMMQFSLADLVTATGGQSITINSVSLDVGNAFVWYGNDNSSDFELREWAVSDFNV
jgi:hypothetical protein